MKKNIIVALTLTLSIVSCHIPRAILGGIPGTNDIRKFKQYHFSKADHPFSFIRSQNAVSAVMDDYIRKNILSREFKTDAFAIIRHDTLLYEWYAHSDTGKIRMGFSISKSLVGAMVGIAIDEHYIHSSTDPVVQYIQKDAADSNFRKLTIENLLDMTANLELNEFKGGLNSAAAKMYYGNNIKSVTQKFNKARPGNKFFQYSNISTQLLVEIIESATGKKFQTYCNDRLISRIGMQSASWLSDKHDNVLGFFGFNATLLDFARFGRLYIKNGILNGDTIVSPAWVKASTDLDTFNVKDYNNQWWSDSKTIVMKLDNDSILNNFINNAPAKTKVTSFNKTTYIIKYPSTTYTAYGLNDQLLIIDPIHEIIIVRLGRSPKKQKSDSLEKALYKLASTL